MSIEEILLLIQTEVEVSEYPKKLIVKIINESGTEFEHITPHTSDTPLQPGV